MRNVFRTSHTPEVRDMVTLPPPDHHLYELFPVVYLGQSELAVSVMHD